MIVGVPVPEEDGTTSGVFPRVLGRDSGTVGAVVIVTPADAGVKGAVLVLVVGEAEGGTDPRADVTSAMFWSLVTFR